MLQIQHCVDYLHGDRFTSDHVLVGSSDTTHRRMACGSSGGRAGWQPEGVGSIPWHLNGSGVGVSLSESPNLNCSSGELVAPLHGGHRRRRCE